MNVWLPKSCLKFSPVLMSFVLLGVGVPAGADQQQGEYDTPKQPWSDFRVHQMDRPHPAKVEAKGCVCAKPPAGAVVLFDGSGTDAFTRAWTVRDGVMVATKHPLPKTSGDIWTKQGFGDCHLHLEWRIPAGREVTSQMGGNSGVFLMDRYEIQIQESYKNVTYADGQAAAIYGQTPPKVNASLPQGEWQSYDIIFEAPVYGEKGLEKPARVTVIHNGVKVHDQQVIYGPTVHKKVATYPVTHPAKAPIRLQWHGDPIEFRNIWVAQAELGNGE